MPVMFNYIMRTTYFSWYELSQLLPPLLVVDEEEEEGFLTFSLRSFSQALRPELPLPLLCKK